MAYINSQRVKEIRNEIKSSFPGFKISVTKDHHSGVSISILEAPVLLTALKYEQVNHYGVRNIEDSAKKDILSKIIGIANHGVSYYETGDYGTQPSFYVWLSIGQWDKPFKYIVTDEKGNPSIGVRIKSVKN